MVIAIVILSLLVVFLGYLLYINYKRAEIATKYCEAYVQFVSTLYFKFTETRDRMKDIDGLKPHHNLAIYNLIIQKVMNIS